MNTRHNESKLNIEVDSIESSPQPIVTYARELAQGQCFPFHIHNRAQLVYASNGLMTVTTRLNMYVVPPARAVLMPARVEHRIDANRSMSMRSLYIKPSLLKSFPLEPCILQITPLLRELIITAVEFGNDYKKNSAQGRLMQVILDQIAIQPQLSLSLPLPMDKRLLQITTSLMNNPGDNRILDEWSKEVGASKRTLNRLFSKQTGMTFQSWRQQLRLHRGLELLSMGESVTQVAMELGYENTSAYIAMFRRCLGTSPRSYLRKFD